jgi:hypothetical protein
MIHLPHKTEVPHARPPAAEPVKPAIPAAAPPAASPVKAEAAPAVAASVETTASKPSAGPGYSGVGAHDTNVAAAELARQNAIVAAAGNQSSLKAASIAYHQAVARSGLANGVGVESNMTALRGLGLTGV